MIKIAESLCCQCGTCAGICPKNAIKIIHDKKNEYTPSVDENVCNKCGICLKACPGYSIDSLALNRKIFGSESKNICIGNFKKCYIGNSNDQDILKIASSGGIISTLLIHALDKGFISGAVVTRLSDEKPCKPEVFIARTREEILSAAQSKYLPVPVNFIIKTLLKEKGKFAVVGLPCHIYGFRKAEELNPTLKNRIVLHLGLICGHNEKMTSSSLYCERNDVPLGSVKKIEYRSGGWPGKLKITQNNGSFFSESFLESFFHQIHRCKFFLPFYCTVCSDVMNEMADISFGDAWLTECKNRNEGMSIIICRTNVGNKLINNCSHSGKISIIETDVSTIIASQIAQIAFKKKNIVSRLNILRFCNKRIPQSNFPYMKPTLSDYLGALVLFFQLYFANFIFFQKIIKRTPIIILKLYGNIIKFLTSMPPLRLLFIIRKRKRIELK